MEKYIEIGALQKTGVAVQPIIDELADAVYPLEVTIENQSPRTLILLEQDLQIEPMGVDGSKVKTTVYSHEQVHRLLNFLQGIANLNDYDLIAYVEILDSAKPEPKASKKKGGDE